MNIKLADRAGSTPTRSKTLRSQSLNEQTTNHTEALNTLKRNIAAAKCDALLDIITEGEEKRVQVIQNNIIITEQDTSQKFQMTRNNV